MASSIARAQDPHFSQIYNAPLLYNPALAGIFTGDFRIQGSYRTQWNNLTPPYRTAAMDGELKYATGRGDNFVTVIMQGSMDRAGATALTTTSASTGVNYHKSIGSERSMFLNMAFLLSYVQNRIDPGSITTNNQFNGSTYDPSLPTGEPLAKSSAAYVDAGAGIAFMTTTDEEDRDVLFIGIGASHLNRPGNSFYANSPASLPRKIACNVGLKRYNAGDSWWDVSLAYFSQGPVNACMAGARFNLELQSDPSSIPCSAGAGISVRWKDAIIPEIRLQLPSIMIAMTYDITISRLSSAATGVGAFECTVSYIGLFRNSPTTAHMRCPKF